ncbi:hypothetical protein HFO24_28780 [Rhizobium laguerreae]|uniref:hypothetical protein n=1 Tax=Rhizobium laguerreae TaxID=1076926 RepID=UPI001C9240DE|nr:hypothetical protein [Rhizobium laguerreae]MBY3185614.1 hypothetical protein [Rhizobium laguerreae]
MPPPRPFTYLDGRQRWPAEQGYFLFVSRERFQALEDGRRVTDLCSQSIGELPAGAKRKPMICFSGSKKGEITHIARAEVRYGAESGRDRLDMWNHKELPHALRISAIKKELTGPQAWRAAKALDGGPCSPAAFMVVMDALKKADPKVFKIADKLIDRRPPPGDPEPTASRQNWAYQRDAVITALEIARLPKELFRSPTQLPEGKRPPKSVFDSDKEMKSIEDILVLRDAAIRDPDWQFVTEQLYPAKTFENGATKLTVVLANKLELEKQLGVDLIYVNETLNAVAFVQYKMLRGRDGEDGYRPDGQLDVEIARMDAAAKMLAACGVDDSCDGYRFGTDPFFLKFCKKLLTHNDQGHVPGYYLPLSYWRKLVATPQARGNRGGLIVYPETFGRRHFTPSAFIDMIARGWAGTTTLQTNVLVPYLAEIMRGKTGVVLAVETTQSGDEAPEEQPELVERKFVPPKPRHPGRKRKVIQL